jgi:hypothetical protein
MKSVADWVAATVDKQVDWLFGLDWQPEVPASRPAGLAAAAVIVAGFDLGLASGMAVVAKSIEVAVAGPKVAGSLTFPLPLFAAFPGFVAVATLSFRQLGLLALAASLS